MGDLREVGALPGTFDAAINMWQSLSYFDEETNAAVLRQLRGRLAPGGRFVVDLYNRAYFERYQGVKREEIEGVQAESQGYMEGNRWHSVLTYRDARGGVLGGDHMEWQVYTPDEFEALTAGCGFATRLCCTWSDEMRPRTAEVARMQVVLEREG